MSDYIVRTTPEQRAYMMLFERDRFDKFGGLISLDAIIESPDYEGLQFLVDGVDLVQRRGDEKAKWFRVRSSTDFEIKLDGITEEEWLKRWDLREALRRPIPLGDLSFELARWQVPPGPHPHAGMWLIFINAVTVHNFAEEEDQ